MDHRKTLEEEIFSGFLGNLEGHDDFPQEVLVRFQRLRAESHLVDPERVIQALREGMKEHEQNANSTS